MTEEPRQRVERAAGRARRARLTPAPGSDPSPETPVEQAPEPAPRQTGKARAASSDDDRLTRDRPPHWKQT
ncbi:hypothetical protein ASE14_14620 [Agromyces sp. Root81]|uniref:hypothetical protein n=1 Tax=Agromyces sp. Root81 TaxID=1736601 RepID=UPI0006F591D0|nr:hypothetical protein [Agromyces sp. Root81]KRC59031.1 hypothetical protein ASE14_14620 [Agromyces sp. Root81]